MGESKMTPLAIYRAVLLAFGLVVAGLVFKQLVTLALAVLIVVIIALPLAGFASMLARFRVPRAVGVLVGLLIMLGLLAILVTAIIPVFTHQINQFVNSLPSIVDSLRHRLGHLTGNSPSKAGQQIQQFVNGYTHHPSKLLGPIASIGASVAAAIAAIIVVILTAVYTAIQPEPLLSGVVRVVTPRRRHQAMHILGRLRTAYLGWLRGLVLGMLLLGVLTYLGLRIVGLDFAAFFAILTAIAMIVPYFGALASSIPPILYALTISPGKAVLVTVVYVVAHQIEGNLIQPLVMARAVELHPAVVAVGVVAIERLFGFVGLIVAVPILGTIRVLIQELWIFPMEDRNLAVAKPGPVASEPTPIIRVGPGGGR
ncbi:MAG: AI-2E family transporter [Solirubrobacteraceae bacterium]